MKNGGGSRVAFIDETTSREQFYQVILPKFIMKSPYELIAISSAAAADGDNWISRMLNIKDVAGESIISSNSVQVVCKACRKLEPKEMIKCRHIKEVNLRRERERESKARRERFSKAYEQEGLGEENRQENLGVTTRLPMMPPDEP
ncbi:MAG: hypothetical protein ACTSUE_15820 [Promethearchaeota archaeon]